MISKEEVQVESNKDEENITFKEIFASFVRRPKLLIFSTLIFFSGTVGYTLYERIKNPVFRGNFALMVSDPIGSGASNDGISAGVESLAKNKTSIDIPLLKVFLKSPIALQEIANEYNLSLKYLVEIIDIKTSGDFQGIPGKVINVSINLKDKKLGNKIIKKLSENYINLAIKMRQKRLKDGLTFLNEEAPAIKAKNDKTETKLSLFRKLNNVVDPNEESFIFKEVINKYETDMITTKSSIKRLEEIKKDVENNKLNATDFIESYNQISEFDNLNLKVKGYDQKIIDQGQELENELKIAKSKFTKNSYVVKALEQNLTNMRPELLKAQIGLIDASIKTSKDILISLNDSLEKLNQEFTKFPTIIKNFDAIQQEREINQETLISLIKARENFRLEIAQKTAPWTIISPPIMYEKPVGPPVLRYLSLGAFISFIFGGLVTFLRDKYDNVYHTKTQIINDLGTICLGSIPHVSFFEGVRENKRFVLEALDEKIKDNKDNEDKIDSYERFFYQEAFRNIITSLRFLESDKEIKTIALTSSIPAEGKSLVNVLLAKTFSELDKNVLLIDADMRKPQLHLRLGLNNLKGLSNLITDSSLKLKDVIQKVKNYPNWNIITAGIIPPDPTRLLSSKRMSELINDLKALKEYDLIIFDTPPVIGLADASLISEKTDGMILLVSTDKVPRGLPKEALQLIDKTNSEFLGIITNSIKKDKNKLLGYDAYRNESYSIESIYSNYANQDDSDKKNENNTILGSKRIFKYLSRLINWLEK